jgi:hypothetical protein
MNDITGSTERIRQYVADLGARLQARQEWTDRHPDHESPQFTADEDTYFRYQSIGHTKSSFESSYDPNDPTPNTSDLLSAQRFFDVAYIAITALDKATGEHNE